MTLPHRLGVAAIFVVACLFAGCTRAPLKNKNEALRRVWTSPALADDLPRETLLRGLKEQAQVLRSKPEGTLLTFGPTTMLATEYAKALDSLAAFAESHPDNGQLNAEIEARFDFYLPYGGTRWGQVLMTSYYEPEIPGALKKTAAFTEPLLSTPDDLVEVSLGKLDDRFSDLGQLRGRILKQKTARGTAQLGPYFSREEIEKGALRNRKLELVWTDPVDAFFLQIQGSGTLLLQEGGTMRVGYADQNGHPYQAIGKFLRDVMPIEKITLASLESHLRALEAPKAQELLNKNPSYVFFQKREGPALTSVGSPVLPGRTIATDNRYFPKGTLAFLEFQKPVFETPESADPKEWKAASRFVFDQDTGGAIRGGGRLDLFWGSGKEAKQSAGVIKQSGTLYYLVPRLVQSPVGETAEDGTQKSDRQPAENEGGEQNVGQGGKTGFTVEP